MKLAELSTLPQYFKWKWLTDPKNFNIESYLRKTLEIHDADDCGDSISYWVVQDDEGRARFWKCYHSWSIDYNPDWNLENDFEISEIAREELSESAKKNLIYVV